MDDAPQNHPGTGHDSSATLIAPDAEAPADDATPETAPDEKLTSAGSRSVFSANALAWPESAPRPHGDHRRDAGGAGAAPAEPHRLHRQAPRRADSAYPSAQPTATASPTPTLIPGFQFVADSRGWLYFPGSTELGLCGDESWNRVPRRRRRAQLQGAGAASRRLDRAWRPAQRQRRLPLGQLRAQRLQRDAGTGLRARAWSYLDHHDQRRSLADRAAG